MKTPIKLGQKPPCEPCCAPTPTSAAEYFPTVYLSGKEFESLPKSGTMTVKFKRRSLNTSEQEDKTHVDVSVDLMEIVSVDGEKSEESEENTGDVLDRLRAELLEKGDED